MRKVWIIIGFSIKLGFSKCAKSDSAVSYELLLVVYVKCDDFPGEFSNKN